MKTKLLLAALVAFVLVAFLAFSGDDCASLIRKVEASPSYLKPSKEARERYEECRAVEDTK
jgi:hypothetical protein